MNLATTGRILKSLDLISQMPKGEVMVRPKDISFWSCTSHSTTYRYLAKLSDLGYVKGIAKGYRKGIVLEYRITEKGKAYLDGLKYLTTFKEVF